MSDETTLLPCPFCGGNIREPITKRWTNCIGDVSITAYSAWVECEKCNLIIETDSVYETKKAAENAAIAAWNTRAMHGTLTADDVRDLIERHSDASSGNGRDFRNGAYEAIADELNAELGSGTNGFMERLVDADGIPWRDGDTEFVNPSGEKCRLVALSFSFVRHVWLLDGEVISKPGDIQRSYNPDECRHPLDDRCPMEERVAELGSGTSDVQHVKSGAMYDVWRYTCCGYEHAERVSEEAIPQNFCPNRGKRVSA